MLRSILDCRCYLYRELIRCTKKREKEHQEKRFSPEDHGGLPVKGVSGVKVGVVHSGSHKRLYAHDYFCPSFWHRPVYLV